MKLERVNIHGATLASLLHSVASSPSPADGVLFGHATRNTREDIHDDFATVNIDTDEAHITSFVCSSSTRSLSNGLGEVQAQQLDALLSAVDGPAPPSSVLGWFSYRPDSDLTPSMREAAVTNSLWQHLRSRLGAAAAAVGKAAGAQAAGAAGSTYSPHYTLLLLLTRRTDHNSATVTLQFRSLQVPEAGPGAAGGAFLPAPLRLLNLGGPHGGARAPFAEQPPCIAPAKVGSKKEARPLQAPARQADAVVKSVEEYVEGALKQLMELSRQACTGGLRNAVLRQENAALQQQLVAARQASEAAAAARAHCCPSSRGSLDRGAAGITSRADDGSPLITFDD